MDSPASLISQLYARTQSAIRPSAAPDPGTATAPTGPASWAQSFVETLRQGEKTATEGLTGRAEPQSVVMALAQTELAIETAVTLRDKVVEAYQEILRMPV